MNVTDFNAVLAFIIEVEKLKTVNRRIKVIGTDRYENSAEHSWQIALLAVSILPLVNKSLDVEKVVKMLLLHDVVEIDTGDKFAYDSNHTDTENETAAAKRIFALLPKAIGQDFMSLWLEYENKSSPEAEFAYGMDRLMPVFLNLHNNGQSWREHGITKAQVIAKNSPAEKASPELWQFVLQRLDEAEQQGMFGAYRH